MPNYIVFDDSNKLKFSNTHFDTKLAHFWLILAQNGTNIPLFKTHLIHNYRESSLKIGVHKYHIHVIGRLPMILEHVFRT